jgi:hypothetical protein
MKGDRINKKIMGWKFEAFRPRGRHKMKCKDYVKQDTKTREDVSLLKAS